MGHIHTKPGQRDFTASAFIIRTDSKEPCIMLHMHKKLGKFLQFGGHVELHETPWQTVAHELLEESGYELAQLQVLQPKDRIKNVSDTRLHPVPITLNTHNFGNGVDHYHTDIGFALVTDQAPKHQPAEGESKKFKLMTANEISELPKNLIAENVQASCLFALGTCLPKWEKIPATSFSK